MNRPICVCTGWYASKMGHNNERVDNRVQHPDYLEEVWLPHITNQIDVATVIVYQSDCEVKTTLQNSRLVNVVQGMCPPTQAKHDDACAVTYMGAMHALCNKMDLVIIEQDCLVVGLHKAIEYAQSSGGSIIYGVTPEPADLSVGENSFVYVPYKFLQSYLEIQFSKNFHLWNDTRGFPELIYRDMFRNLGSRWNFGYGRNRPINYDNPMYYAQQMSTAELDMFLSKLSLPFIPS